MPRDAGWFIACRYRVKVNRFSVQHYIRNDILGERRMEKDGRSLVAEMRKELSHAAMCCQSPIAETSSVNSTTTANARSECQCSTSVPLCLVKYRTDCNETNKSTDCQPITNESLKGCMDQRACNYNPNATINDDTSCTFELVGRLNRSESHFCRIILFWHWHGVSVRAHIKYFRHDRVYTYFTRRTVATDMPCRHPATARLSLHYQRVTILKTGWCGLWR